MKTEILCYCGRVDSRGGSKQSLLMLIRLLARNNLINIKVVLSNEGWFSEQLQKNNIPYIVINEPSKTQEIRRNSTKLKILLNLFSAAFSLMKNWIELVKHSSYQSFTIVNERRDLILLLPLVLFNRKKTIFWVHVENFNKMDLLLMKWSGKVITVTDVVKKMIIKKGIPSSKVNTIPNFCFEHNDHFKLNKDIFKNGKSPILAIIGTIQPIKGQADAIMTFKKVLDQYPNAELWIIGSVPHDSENYLLKLKDLISDYKIDRNVIFKGVIDNVIDVIFNHVDLVLIPSQTEAFCRVAMEAASVGVPSVAYGVGGLKEVIIDTKTGFLVEKDDVISMANKSLILLNSEQFYREIQENAYKNWKSKYSDSSIEDKLIKLLS